MNESPAPQPALHEESNHSLPTIANGNTTVQSTPQEQAVVNEDAQTQLEAGLVLAYNSLSEEKKLLADKLKNFLNGNQIPIADLQALCRDIAMDKGGDEVKNYLQKQSSFKNSIMSLVARAASVKVSVKSETGRDAIIAMNNKLDAEEKLIDYLYNVKFTHDDFEVTQNSPATVEMENRTETPSLTVQVPGTNDQLGHEQRVEKIETALEPLFQSDGAAPDSGAILITLRQPYNRDAIESLNNNNEFIAKIVAYVNRLILLDRGTVSKDDLAVVAGIKKAFTNEQVQDAVNRLTGDVVNAQQSQAEKPDERETNKLSVGEAVPILFTGMPDSISQNAQQITRLFTENEKEMHKNILQNYSRGELEATLHLLNIFNKDEDQNENGINIKGDFDDIIASLKKLLRETSPVGDVEKPQGEATEAGNDSAVSRVTIPTEKVAVSGGTEAVKGANNEILQSVADQRALEKENAKKSLELLNNLNFSELYEKSALIVENLSTFDANVEAGKVTNEAEQEIRATKKSILREMNTLENKEHKEDDDDEKRTKLQAFLNILNQLYPRIQIEASSVSKLGSVLRGFATKTKSRLVTDIQWVKNRAGSMVTTTQAAKERMLVAVQKLKKEVSNNLREGVGMKREKISVEEGKKIEPVLVPQATSQNTQSIVNEKTSLARSPDAEGARKNILARVPQLLEKWNSPANRKVRLGVSVGLLSIGIVGTMGGAAGIVGAVGAGKMVLRAASATGVAIGAYGTMRNFSEKSSSHKLVALSTATTAGLASFFAGDIAKELINFFDINLDTMFSGYGTSPQNVPGSDNIELMKPYVAKEYLGNLNFSPNVFQIPDLSIAPGTSLSSRLLDNGGELLGKLFDADIKELSSEQKENLLRNVLSRLDAVQVKNLGIESGNVNSLQAGETINMQKFAEFAQKMRMGEGEGLLSRSSLYGSLGK